MTVAGLGNGVFPATEHVHEKLFTKVAGRFGCLAANCANASLQNRLLVLKCRFSISSELRVAFFMPVDRLKMTGANTLRR